VQGPSADVVGLARNPALPSTSRSAAPLASWPSVTTALGGTRSTRRPARARCRQSPRTTGVGFRSKPGPRVAPAASRRRPPPTRMNSNAPTSPARPVLSSRTPACRTTTSAPPSRRRVRRSVRGRWGSASTAKRFVALDVRDNLGSRYERAGHGEDFIAYTPAIPAEAEWLKVSRGQRLTSTSCSPTSAPAECYQRATGEPQDRFETTRGVVADSME
jgi:hypothetical protein